MQLRIDIYHGKAGLLKLAPAWHALTARLEGRRYCHYPEWYLSHLEPPAPPSYEILFLAVIHGDDLIAVLPLRRRLALICGETVWTLELVADREAAPVLRDIVLLRDRVPRNLLEVVANSLQRVPIPYDAICLENILEDSHAAFAVDAAPNFVQAREPGSLRGVCAFLSCGPDDRPFERHSQNFRQNLRKAHNKIDPARVRHVSARRADELAACYPQFLEVESSGWKSQKGTSVRQRPHVEGHYRNLITQFAPLGACEIHLMQLDSKTISALFCLVVDGVCYVFKTGYDEEFGPLMPGHLLLEHVVRTRGAAGTISAITMLHDPDWFMTAWKPDRKMRVWNQYIFDSSERGQRLHRAVLCLKGLDRGAETKSLAP